MSLVLVIALLAGALGGGLASAGVAQSFTDVPAEHPFFEDIEAIAAAGITTGFADGTYRPGGDVSRQAMAAFMRRGFARVATDDALVNTMNGNGIQIVQVELTAGAVGEGTGGYVVVQGVVEATSAPASCTCELRADIRDDADSRFTWDGVHTMDPDAPVGAGVKGGVATMGVFPIDGGETKTFTLRADVLNATDGNTTLIGQLIATYVPFDGTGNSPTAMPA